MRGAFLAIQGEQHPGRPRTRGANDVDGFADGRARRDDVVDDQDSAAQGVADDAAAFTVVLGFLAVECKLEVAPRMLRKRRRRDGDQRDALVGRAEQHIELKIGACDGRRVRPPHRADGGAGVEQAGIEKIRAFAARLQREAAEAQNSQPHAQFDELTLIGQGHGP